MSNEKRVPLDYPSEPLTLIQLCNKYSVLTVEDLVEGGDVIMTVAVVQYSGSLFIFYRGDTIRTSDLWFCEYRIDDTDNVSVVDALQSFIEVWFDSSLNVAIGGDV